MSSEVAALDRAPRRSSRWLERSRRQALVRELILRAPRLGLHCAGALARTLHRAGRVGPTPRALRRVLSRSGTKRPIGRLARHIAASSFKSECLDLLKHRSGAARELREALLDGDAPGSVASIRGRTVVATFHAGPLLAVRWALERAEIPTLVLAHDSHVEMEAGQERIDTSAAGVSSRAGAIVEAVSFLEAHERSVVLMAPDGGVADRPLTVELLGGRMAFFPGAAAIARLASAQMLPIMGRFTSATRVGVCVGEARGVEGWAEQAEATRGLARFLEARFESQPEDLSTFYVSRLAAGQLDGSPEPPSVPSRHRRRSAP